MDEQELTVKVEEIDNHLFSMHDTVNHAIIKVDEANTLSHFAVERIDTKQQQPRIKLRLINYKLGSQNLNIK